MPNIGDPITPSIPPVGASGPQYATDIDAILTEIVARLSAKVPLSSLSINGDLSLSGNSLTNVSNVVFSNALLAPSGSPFSRWAVFNGDVYWVNSAGAVQLTTGAALNASSIGGITGAYGGANPAQLRYDNVNTRYDLYANFATATWAYCRALGFDIPGGATSTAFARLQWAGSSNITMTLPATLPAANQLLTLDNAGLITTGTSAAMLSNSNITLSGTGTYKHGLKTKSCWFNNSRFITTTTNTVPSVSDSTTYFIALPEFSTHERIVNVTIGFIGALQRANSTVTLAQSCGGDPPTTNITDIASTTFSNTGTARKTVSAVNLTPTAGQIFFIKLVTGASGNGGNFGSVFVDYDIP